MIHTKALPKRILAFALAATIIIAFTPAITWTQEAHASAESILIGNANLNSTNPYLDSNKTARTSARTGDIAYFDRANEKLYLYGGSISTENSGQRSLIEINGGNIEIVLQGTTTVTSTTSSSSDCFGIYSIAGDITISGTGTLNLTAGTSTSGASFGIYCVNNKERQLTINSGTVNVTTGTAPGTDKTSEGILTDSFKVNGGNITVTGNKASTSYGVYATTTFTMTGGTLTATGGTVYKDNENAPSSTGIASSGAVAISGGTVAATGGDVETKSSSGTVLSTGIDTNSTVNISGGTVTAKGGRAVRPSGSSAISQSTGICAYDKTITITNGEVISSGHTAPILNSNSNGAWIVTLGSGVTAQMGKFANGSGTLESVSSGTTYYITSASPYKYFHSIYTSGSAGGTGGSGGGTSGGGTGGGGTGGGGTGGGGTGGGESTAYAASGNITNGSLTFAEAPDAVNGFTGTIKPADGYTLPGTIDVAVGGKTITAFTYDKTAGTVTIPASVVSGDVVITAACVKSASDTNTVGNKFTLGTLKYKITKSAVDASGTTAAVNGKVQVTGAAKSSYKILEIPKTVSYGGNIYTVTTIANNAFRNSTKLKTVTIKSTSITSIGAKAFKKCKKGMTFKLPKAKYNKYKELLKTSGIPTGTKYKKI